MPALDTTSSILDAMRQSAGALEEVTAALRESLGSLRVPGSGTFAFRRTTDALPVMPGIEPSDYVVPEGFFEPGGPGHGTTSFMVFNPNLCPVILRGTSESHSSIQFAAPFQGWPCPPGLNGSFTTQYPRRMSALFFPCLGMAVPAQADWKALWVFYGGGN